MDMNLFDYMRTGKLEKDSPLAARLRPLSLEEIVGQKHIIGEDKLLYQIGRASCRERVSA